MVKNARVNQEVAASRSLRGRDMAGLGHLERTVMETLWTLSADAGDHTFTAREVNATLPDHAYTTVLTVLNRLVRKDLVEQIPDGKTHHYRPTGSREAYISQLMHEALATTPDRDAALVHFAKSVRPAEANILRSVLGRLDPQSAEPPPR